MRARLTHERLRVCYGVEAAVTVRDREAFIVAATPRALMGASVATLIRATPFLWLTLSAPAAAQPTRPPTPMPVVPSPPARFRGLVVAEVAAVERILAQRDEGAFDREIDALVRSCDRRAVLILTHLMIALPWVPELEPVGLNDGRMRKLRIERILDRWIASSEQDDLSARYFRCVGYPGDEELCPGTVEQARNALIDWTLKTLDKLRWNPELGRFEAPEDGG